MLRRRNKEVNKLPDLAVAQELTEAVDLWVVEWVDVCLQVVKAWLVVGVGEVQGEVEKGVVLLKEAVVVAAAEDLEVPKSVRLI
jgi:hypothetical protein